MPMQSPITVNAHPNTLAEVPASPADQEALTQLLEQLQAVQSVNRQMQAQNQQIQAQLLQLQAQLNNHQQAPRSRPLPPVPQGNSDYSNYVRLGFRALKWLFLFLVGFSITCVVSASLRAPEVVATLTSLMSLLLTPMVVLTLCIIIGCAILESLR